MKKQQSLETIEDIEDIAFPVANVPSFARPAKPAENPAIIKKIIRGAVQGAYQKKSPSEYDAKYNRDQMPYVSKEEVEFVTNLIESLEPANAIEAALASQFAISYIQGLDAAQGKYKSDTFLNLFRFGHEVLEAMTKYRTKGAQQIQVNYNHNQGQINNIKVVESENKSETIEVI